MGSENCRYSTHDFLFHLLHVILSPVFEQFSPSLTGENEAYGGRYLYIKVKSISLTVTDDIKFNIIRKQEIKA